jgi:hypothetical protein
MSSIAKQEPAERMTQENGQHPTAQEESPNSQSREEASLQVETAFSPSEEAYVAILSERSLMMAKVLADIASAFQKISLEMMGCQTSEEVASVELLIKKHYMQALTKLSGVYTGLVKVEVPKVAPATNIVTNMRGN